MGVAFQGDQKCSENLKTNLWVISYSMQEELKNNKICILQKTCIIMALQKSHRERNTVNVIWVLPLV